MKFNEFVLQLSSAFKVAEKSDNQKILNLYNSLSMEGGVFSIRFVKDPDYFKFCNYEGPDHYIILAVNNEGVAEGMANFNVRLSYLNGKKVNVCHISDLRLIRKKDRKVKWSWTDLGNAIVSRPNEIDEMKGCNHFIGSYVGANKYAISAIKDTSPWGISAISDYEMISILGRLPLKYLGQKSSPKSDLKVSISQAKESDIPELKKYLDAQNREKAFGYIYDIENGELERRFRVWDDFSISSFYLARGTSGEILGCFATWSPTKGRRIIVDKFPEKLALMAKGVKLLGKKVPKVGSELEILYITNLELNYKLTTDQKKFIFNEILDALYKSGKVKNYHVLAFCDYYKEMLSPGMEKFYVLQKTPVVLYQLHPKDGAVDVVKEEELKLPPGHEMVLT
jgi:hypothetical protein